MNAEVMTLDVVGMHCGGCVGTVTTAASRVPGVASATVDLDAHKVTVATDGTVPAAVVSRAVAAAVKESGYDIAEDDFS